MADRFKLISAVHLFLIEDSTIWLLKRYNTGYEDGKYSVPAGHLDGNEGATLAMCREALEEAGVKIKPEDLDLIHVMHRKADDERMDLFFRARKWQGNPEVMEPDKCDEIKLFPLDSLPLNIIPYVKCAIENFRDGIIYSEFGWS